MRIQQFIKSLNNTEIGKGGTHECYVLVSKKVERTIIPEADCLACEG